MLTKERTNIQTVTCIVANCALDGISGFPPCMKTAFNICPNAFN